MIKIKNLYKSFGENEILKDLNLTVNDGECICIIGKSGIGKSILLKHITGLMVPDRGEVWLHDEMINSLSFKSLFNLFKKVLIINIHSSGEKLFSFKIFLILLLFFDKQLSTSSEIS